MIFYQKKLGKSKNIHNIALYFYRNMKAIFSFFLLFLALNTWAQSFDFINSDRPDQSESAYILQKHTLQGEMGFSVDRNGLENQMMLRFGLFKPTEMRLETSSNIEGMAFSFSLKQRLFSEDNFFADTAIIGYFGGNFSRNLQETFDLCLAFENSLTELLSVAYNLSSLEGFQVFRPTLALYFQPKENIYLFGELFSDFEKKKKPNHQFDFGLMWAFSYDFQADIAFGSSFSGVKHNAFVNFGVAKRF